MLALVVVPILFIFAVLFTLGFRPNTRHTFRKLYEEGLPRGEVGPHELELTDDLLVDRTAYSERRTPLQDFQGVASDGDRTFLFIGPLTAYVIPHRAVPAVDLEAFIDAIRIRMSEIAFEPRAEADQPRD